MGNKVYLGLGSNRGEKLKYLKLAVDRINGEEKCNVLKCSSVYETEPYGKTDQPNFLNAVIMISTEFQLEELLEFVKLIEIEVGRSEFEKWGPREIDIDILLYDDMVFADHHLSVPHIELTERDFVLKPILEIDPEITHPAFGMKLKEIDESFVKKNIIKKHAVDLLNNSEEDIG